MKLLIVEDEPYLLKSLEDFAAKEGYLYDSAGNFQTAQERVYLYDYDCLILDINLPDGSGFEILEILKKEDKTDGVIILSARDSLDDKLTGLELGADDYLIKPFYFSELNARIKAVIRRKQFKTNKPIRFANMVIDLGQYLVRIDNFSTPISFTKKEYAILIHLINNNKRIISKMALAEYVWGDYVDEAQSFDFLFSQIKNLKRKLKDAGAQVEINNIYGVGYQIQAL
ncbi:MAG: response regulator transcription factor [Bacteroidota bacterium]|jgi:DNA-binding response OmpR family regulator|uniref:Response regulator with CheY-like receiver domain and winged-helix DNA-binding domain n=5 Tax=Flavobacteriaceae TaxID=49546 RepID=I3CB84_9FLAO|nr:MULTISPECIES: response regulator transcription factor [Flavobacteriaceae]MAG87303.1 DNA-binding response regulator [Flavobacteriaceae bacterium]MEE2772043.1 response regulator transcription factor [Bacteroidota bacterium]MUP46103.1 response regulator transcription factor [Christiangramia bathymodioli]ADF51813.1 two-component system response regulator [Zunongwangia profunda SM-A87]EIJ40877.1 response regulator with CheY-like receiver domain and winged-helix DNA-binding domain [Galbibacter or|tara:strand:- start:10883 stop:11566 length:684 start_codon:yes stop_codon:yes gene_type:complete